MKVSLGLARTVISVLLCCLVPALAGCAMDVNERDDGAPATWSRRPMRHDRMWNSSVEDDRAATNPFIE